ncbi:Sushi, von [Collichthys lucidus]|uniref:Sushi, von n=1 Tax=Collichthys lucidus TaxID=240159 RepID=A0A4U5VXV6_COLLU|nr:Sushi, von [Collichthys lucidus]
MKRDTRYVKGQRLRMEEVGSCQLSGREASVSLFFSHQSAPVQIQIRRFAVETVCVRLNNKQANSDPTSSVSSPKTALHHIAEVLRSWEGGDPWRWRVCRWTAVRQPHLTPTPPFFTIQLESRSDFDETLLMRFRSSRHSTGMGFPNILLFFLLQVTHVSRLDSSRDPYRYERRRVILNFQCFESVREKRLSGKCLRMVAGLGEHVTHTSVSKMDRETSHVTRWKRKNKIPSFQGRGKQAAVSFSWNPGNSFKDFAVIRVFHRVRNVGDLVWCTVPRCILQQTASFIQNVCNNHFEAACGVRCDPDFDLQGTGIRLCQADGTWSGTPASCARCRERRKKKPAGRSGRSWRRLEESKDIRKGGDRRRRGSSRQERQEKGVGEVKRLKRKMPNVTERRQRESLLMKGLPVVKERKRCHKDENERRDAEPPWIQCPVNIVAETDERHGTANVSWNVPTATDNSKEEVAVQVKPVYSPPQLLPIGKETITYIATDRSGNQANCSFTVTVIGLSAEGDKAKQPSVHGPVVGEYQTSNCSQGSRYRLYRPVCPLLHPPSAVPQLISVVQCKTPPAGAKQGYCNTEPPVIDRCRSPPAVQATDTETAVVWEVPQFSDNSDLSSVRRFILLLLCSTPLHPLPPLMMVKQDLFRWATGKRGSGEGFVCVCVSVCVNNGGRLTVTGSHSPGSRFPVGETLVQYTATDAAGNSRTCNLTITVQGTACEQPYVPVNGEFICSEEEEGVNCTLHCKDGYSFTQDAVHSYFCAYNGVWEPPYSADRPDCSASCCLLCRMAYSTHTSMSQYTDLLVFISGDNAHFIIRPFLSLPVNRIANNGFKPFEMLFKASRCDDVDLLPNICSSDDVTCKLEVMSQGHCLEYNYDYENGFSIVPGGWSNSWGPQGTQDYAYFESGFATGSRQLARRQQDSSVQPHQRTKRHRKIRGPTRDQKIQIFFNITASIPLPISRNDSIEVANQKRLLRTLEQLTNRLKRTLAKQPLSSFHVSSEMIVADPKSLESKRAFLSCRPGSVLKGRMCVQCPVGTYFSLEHNECASCWLGSYQDQEGQLECKSCPEGTSTAYLHSRSITECKGQCKPGSHSLNGLEICESCPLGHFQSRFGARECLVCPDETSTVTRGAVDESECGGDTSPVRQVISPAPVWFPVTLVLEITTSPITDAPTACPVPSTEPPPSPGQPPYSTAPVFHECFLNPCQNKGTCEEVGAGYVCTCMPGFTGEPTPVTCQTVDSRNKMTFNLIPLNVTLLCRMFDTASDISLSGAKCEIDIDECDSAPCQNGGLCRDGMGDFQCQCKPGFLGSRCELEINECLSDPCLNDGLCEDLTEMPSAFNLDFEVSGIHGYVMMDGVMPALTEITCTFWMRSSDTTNYGTPVSYAVEGSDNAFLLIDYNGWVLYVNGKERITDCPAVNTGLWYHIGVSWRSWDGDWRIYINGKPSDGGKGLSVGTTIPGGGALVLGQDQDQRGEGFNPVESFVGSISQLNIWDRVLTPQQIKVLASSCPASHVTHRGNVLAWPDFLTGVVGRVKVNLNSIFCADCPKLENAVPHLHASSVEVSPGAQVHLSCDPGFYLLGEPVLQCQNKGEWSHPLPSCEHVDECALGSDCDEHASCQNTEGSYTCTCIHPYRGDGKNCTEPVKCENPGSPDFGHREGSNFLMGGEVVFGCDVGYELIGSARLLCLETGSWDDPVPYCRALSCPTPTVPENSVMTGNNFTYGSKVTFSCMTGFLPQIPYEFQCLASLRWSGTPPVCHPVTCGGTSDRHERRLHHRQEHIPGSMEVVCEATGEWSRPVPRCVSILCSEPPPLRDAVTVGENYELGNQVHYVCKEGYTLIGSETRECLPSGQWSDSSAQCVPRSCGTPPAIDHAEPYEGHKLFGDTANYYCTDGYTAGNNSKMVCNAQGVWAPPDGMEAPRCIANFCLRPPEVPHAILESVNKPKYASNTEVSYKCEEGFMLNTTATLRCLMGGEWEPSPYDIGCVPVRCSRPESIDRGYVSGSDYSFGAVVAYGCEKGFGIRGEKKRTCKANGEWSGVLPTCGPVTCDAPPLLNNGHIANLQGIQGTRGRYIFNSKVIYACNAGFRLVGRPERICQANRQWSNGDPITCVLLTCDPPPDILHGHYKGSDFQVGRKVQYVCDEGYELAGDATWTCLKFGKWDKRNSPRCSPVQCPEPPLEENHLVLKGVDAESGTVELSCEDGYVLEGAQVLRCMASQEWNGTFPVCKQVFCGALPEVSFGGPSSSSPPFPFSSVVSYTCMDGFTLRKEGSVSCLANGHWSSPYPECIPVECPQPVEISNGIVDVQGLMYLSKALYSCKSGYNLVGNSTVLCGEKGLWIGGVPSCRPIECSIPKQIANGRVVYTKLQFGHSVTYSCLRGYRVHGPETLKCLASGEWDIEPPACVQISCTPPQPIENGFVEGQDHSFGVTIFYSCFPGFQLVGHDHLTCEEFGWSSSVPVCVPSDCGLPPHIDFGEYVRVGGDTGTLASPMDLNFLHGTLIEYSCHKGYDLSSPTRLVCQEDGGWNGTAPSCVPAECETPPNPEHGWVNVTDTSLGSMVRYTCEKGYELEGEPVRQCLSGRLWTKDAPVCRPVSCGDPGAVANGIAHGHAHVYPEVLGYECDRGFVLKGSDTIACQADGRWSGQKPRCEPVVCGPPDVPSDVTFKGEAFSYNMFARPTAPGATSLQPVYSPTVANPHQYPTGECQGSEFGFNSKVKYDCDEGYTLNGESTRVCQSDGLWDKPAPRCDVISCDPPEDISHGFLNGSSFNYDDVVEYVCFDGYEVVGDPILRCSAQGSWVGLVPECRPCVCALPVVKFGAVLGRDRACGDQVHFQCDGGYKLLGPSQAMCEKGGVWSPGVPICGRGRCSAAPPTVPNAVQQGSSATFSDTIIYRCRPGYRAKGHPYLTCGREGRWGEPRISCEPVNCGIPPAVAYARVVGDTFTFPNQVTYRCEDGYKLATQAASLSCQSDGTWSKHSIRCRPVPCPLPTNFSIPHVVITGKEFTPVGGTITLSCPPGLYLQGSALSECQPGGRWAPSISSVSCELVVCEKPPPLLHGVTEGDRYSYGDFVVYSCLPGFEMKGDSIQTCQGDRTWSGTQPVCVAPSCGPPPAVQNALVQTTGETYPHNASYICDAGLHLIGPKTLTCLVNGTWSLPAPTCEAPAKGCDSPKQVPHGKVQEHHLNTRHAVEFLCDKGYNLVGDSLVVCMGSNTWSSTFPTCQPKPCPTPPGWREDGSRNGSQREFYVGQSVRVACPKGQQVRGGGTITCRPDQTWSPISSVCERVSCGPPLHVANGVVRGAVFQFGDVAAYSCFGGYAMEGVGRSSDLHPAVPERRPLRGALPVRVSQRVDGHALSQCCVFIALSERRQMHQAEQMSLQSGVERTRLLQVSIVTALTHTHRTSSALASVQTVAETSLDESSLRSVTK